MTTNVIHWRRTSRRPHLNWAVAIVVAWMALIGVALILAESAHREILLCNFKRVTGIPCPTCGTTRAILALGHGDVHGALTLNPLATIAVSIISISIVARLCLGLTIQLNLKDRGRRALSCIAVALLLCNWIYVILMQR